MRRAWWIVFASLSLTACINISTRLQPEDTTVREELVGEDCVSIVLGLGFGTVDVARAQNRGQLPGEAYGARRIERVRRVEWQDFSIPLFGSRCVVVVGEAARRP